IEHIWSIEHERCNRSLDVDLNVMMGRSFAPRGQTPVIPRLAQRFSQSMISSLTNRGKLRFMVYDGALNAGIFLRFLKRLVRGAERKIFLIVDNLRPHRARIVTAWVAANCDKIELVYLPPYAPEHNPEECVESYSTKRRRDAQFSALCDSLPDEQFGRAGVHRAAIKALQERLSGRIILPGEPGYDDGRKLSNPVFNFHPMALIYCLTEPD